MSFLLAYWTTPHATTRSTPASLWSSSEIYELDWISFTLTCKKLLPPVKHDKRNGMINMLVTDNCLLDNGS